MSSIGCPWALDRYRPLPEWFHDPKGIHGLGHVARVLVWGNRLAERLSGAGERIDLEVVRRAAQFHDVGRVDDGRDAEHGRRSAEWVQAHGATLAPDLTPEQLQRVVDCCQWHVARDHDIQDMTVELRCLKDADGLDRVRIHDLDPLYLRTLDARRYVEDAWALYTATALAPTWEAVRREALARNWWA